MLSNNFLAEQLLLEGDIKIENIKILKEIGRSNSNVYLALLNSEKIAIKKVEIQNDYEYQCFLKEVSMLKSLTESSTAKSIITYHGYFLTTTQNISNAKSLVNFNKLKNQVRKTESYAKKFGYLCMEKAICNLTEFVDLKKNKRNNIKKEQIINAVQNMLSCFSTLENLNIAHCDIKPENILIVNEEKMEVKICDVGSSKVIAKLNEKEETIKGTLSFLAPELVKIEASKITSINPFRSDVYSFGLVLLYIITGHKFSSQERKEIKEEIYFEIIEEWVKFAKEIIGVDEEISEILKKSLEPNLYRRSLFNELNAQFITFCKNKAIKTNICMKKIIRKESEPISIEKSESITFEKTKFPKINSSSSSTLINFHSKKRLTGKISFPNSNSISNRSMEKGNTSGDKNKSGEKKTKYLNEKNKSKSRVSPLHKTTMYSTFSMDKSKTSFHTNIKRIIHVTSSNYNFIPYEALNQEDKIFVLFSPNVLFDSAQTIVINKECTIEIFDKLSSIKLATNLYIEYNEAEIFGLDENVPTLLNFESIFIDLESSTIESGYNNFLRCLCPITLKNLSLNVSNSSITFNEIKLELERLKNKEISKLDLCWDGAIISSDELTEMNEKLSKLPLKKLTLSLDSAYIKTNEKSRWPLSPKCKILYLNLSHNFLSSVIGSLGVSLGELCDLKELFLNLESNSLNDTDIKYLINSLNKVKLLEKSVINVSNNLIKKGVYCFEELANLTKITSLELRIIKCEVFFEEFLRIFENLIKIFAHSLRILKIAYDRKIGKELLTNALLKLMKDEGLLLDIVGYNQSYFMIYVKKKVQGGQKLIKIKNKEHSTKNISQLHSHDKFNENFSSLTSLTAIKTITQNSIKKASKVKEEDELSIVPLEKEKNAKANEKMCEALFTSGKNYECYICLGCIENKESAKLEYFCRACIENCEHKGHHIVRTYERKICNCPYNHNCSFKGDDWSESICAEKLGIHYKREFRCHKCKIGKSLCEGCITECKENHPELVENLPSLYFVCHSSTST